jgi:hypothetical protein
MLCPIMSRPYLRKYLLNGSMIEETAMHKVFCYEEGCKAYIELTGECGLCKK